MEKAKNLFWYRRLQKHGHTGWADPVIYAYDQQERMAFIKCIISKSEINCGVAFDFGCGTGSFSKLLLDMGFTVCGYDPFVRPDISSPKFSYVSNYNNVNCKIHAADLVLSVTVLDHILDEKELCVTLDFIRGCLKPEGVFYMLEYAINTEADREKFNLNNNYQSFRTFFKWESLLRQHGFKVVESFSVPHPVMCPSDGYIAYNRTFLCRLIRRYQGLFSLVKPFRNVKLSKCAAFFVKDFPANLQPGKSSPLRLIRCSVAG